MNDAYSTIEIDYIICTIISMYSYNSYVRTTMWNNDKCGMIINDYTLTAFNGKFREDYARLLFCFFNGQSFGVKGQHPTGDERPPKMAFIQNTPQK